MSTTTRTGIVCHYCDAEEGQLHKLGCDMERCPTCGRQLMLCRCWIIYIPEEHHHPDMDRMDPKVIFWWAWRVEKYGRVPFIHYPNICARCGEVDPQFFKVPDAEWEHYVELSERNSILCRPCYDTIRQLIDKGTGDGS